MTTQADEELVRRCLEGDRGAFGTLVEKYQATIYNVALRMVHDTADAEDVAQVAFVRAFQKLSTFDPKFKFFSWLYRIVVNEALNILKQRQRFEPLEAEEVSETAEETGREEERVEGEDLERRIQECLMELKVEYRTVVVLKHFQELSYAEIGQILDIPEKTVKSRLFSARAVLRMILRKKGIGSHG
jgi:RNA polymerase sigma-70 factor, ECF subfamily